MTDNDRPILTYDFDLGSRRVVYVSTLLRDFSHLDDVQTVGSTGLHTILRLRRRAVRLSVVHASAAVRRVFEVTGVPLDDAEGAARTSTAA